MPQPAHERLRELENDVRDLRLLPAAAVRDRGRRRGRRQLAAWTVAGAVVATTAGAAIAWPRPDTTTPVAGRPPLNCILALPENPADVRLRVVDGGAAAGRLEAVVSDLRARAFTVSTGAASPAGTTTLRYGPASVGAAALMRAELHGDVAMRFDPARSDDTIDVILGPSFDRLATPTEVNQNLVTAGKPTAPAEC
ncbi:LytR C-terminal domain-containing protein [Paractinoplanes hotanensis]|uniref:LytR C-terminal domain-containing protein n=1 Tax=Paractinoplanes hotanensis TaxID=2906497 RepID=A0ABT0Y489_9ACTN|nr:LytR C-terminal domain-containing protein [Actinoplanes hotanensis]MCM4080851.1 LytR C-terminal domain-containing protein [Actinoplanes hotanensis]